MLATSHESWESTVGKELVKIDGRDVLVQVPEQARPRRMSALTRWLAIAMVAVSTLVVGAAATAPPATAAPATASSGWIPEYYQFCYNHPPFPWWAATSYYKTAIAHPDSVECQHLVVWGNWGIPVLYRTYYDWNTVCRSEGYSGGWWDGRYPRCW